MTVPTKRAAKWLCCLDMIFVTELGEGITIARRSRNWLISFVLYLAPATLCSGVCRANPSLIRLALTEMLASVFPVAQLATGRKA